MTELPVGVLLIDHRTLPCRGLRDVMDKFSSLALAAEVRTSHEAVRHCVMNPENTCVVIVDATTPAIDGVAVVTDLCAVLDAPPPILCLVHEYDDAAREMVEAGAAGLLYMHSSPEELEAAVLVLGAGYSISLTSPAERPRYSWGERSEEADPLRGLSEREFEVLRFIAQGFSNIEIATLLELQESTVKSHVQRLLRKVDRRSRAELAVLAYEKCMVRSEMYQSA